MSPSICEASETDTVFLNRFHRPGLRALRTGFSERLEREEKVAWLLENHITHDGKKTVGFSIETYRFEPDGSVVIRTYYRVPARTDDELGEMFKQYLPQGG